MLDRGNTTVGAPLDAGGVFTGQATRIADLVRLLNLVVSDKIGTLYIEYSLDGETWPVAREVNVLPGNPLFEESKLAGAWYRVRYENGPLAQSVFILISQASYHQSTDS
jgi:hypothetical protein